MLYRLVECSAKLREVVHSFAHLGIVAVVQARQEADIIQAAEAALKAASESDRPRRTHFPVNGSLVRGQYAAEDLYQRRLPLAVAPKNRQALVARQAEVEILEQGFPLPLVP
ncbi:hypothetical protein D3C71_1979620 [compost metagenome]